MDFNVPEIFRLKSKKLTLNTLFCCKYSHFVARGSRHKGLPSCGLAAAACAFTLLLRKGELLKPKPPLVKALGFSLCCRAEGNAACAVGFAVLGNPVCLTL
ncbi:hypothetical protein [Comamonas jiangduensis]|uniref:hypothetical protein n=1 Tax=Comamonas jiangduensis TaxID=1194168 RepID=UPI003BF84903